MGSADAMGLMGCNFPGAASLRAIRLNMRRVPLGWTEGALLRVFFEIADFQLAIADWDWFAQFNRQSAINHRQ
jgi:hypothetical protein